MSRSLKDKLVDSNRALKILGKFPRSNVMVLGDIMLDRYLWGSVERISPEAPVPVVHVGKESTNLGGAANVAANVYALGAKPLLLGIAGKDQYSDELRKNLRNKKISASGIIFDNRRPTTVKTRIVAHSQQIVRVDREDSSEIKPDLVEELLSRVKKYMTKIDGIIISDYGKGVITYDLLSQLIPIARSEGKFIAVDPKEVHFKSYRNVSVITPNHHEAGFISGRKIRNDRILEDVGWKLHAELELDSLLITLGERGMALFEKNRKLVVIPAEAKTVYDVTGAGDTVIATLTVAATAGASMREAAYLANIAAGLAVAQFGTARITKEQLAKKLKNKR